MSLNPRLLEKLACPNCGNPLRYDILSDRLFCTIHSCNFAISGDIPLLLSDRTDSEPTSDFDYVRHYETDAREFDYFEQQNGATEHSESRLRQTILSKIPTQAQSILDVGSGSAWVAKNLIPTKDLIVSMDATIINTSKALERYPSPNHLAVVADAFALPFQTDTFDCVIAAEIIEHVTDPKAFVRSLLRVIPQGGVLIISTPYKEVLRYGLCIHCNQKTPLNSHLHTFDENVLHSLFEDEEIKNFEWDAFNNKALLFVRTHVVLRYLPFSFWSFIDKLANLIYSRPVNIVLRVTK